MSVEIRKFPARAAVTVKVDGTLDLTRLHEFQQLLLDARDSRAKYIIDLAATNEIRDSGIAILLMLVKRIGPARLEVFNCSVALRPKLLCVLGPVRICTVS